MTGAPFDATKDAAKAAAKALPAGACLEVAFFDSRVTVAVPLGAVDAPAASKSIDTMTPGGGTEFVSALDASVLALHRVAGATTKRVIFLSDGQAPSESVLATVARIRGEGATLSAIALGRAADEKLLRSMADAGKGRFYIVIDPSVLERIFVREITL